MAQQFACFDIKEVRFLGNATFPNFHVEEPGTEHLFGDVVYIFERYDDKDKGLMWFRRSEHQPYLELD